MDAFYISLFFVFGLILGSFFNVVGLRIPREIPFTTNRSYCPKCNRQLSGFELIPVLSYIFSRGKCFGCKKTVSKLYPIVELMTAILFALSYIKFGFQIELIILLLLVSMLMIIFVTDITYMLIPNKVLLFFLPLFVLVQIISPLIPWSSSLLGSIVGFLLIAIIIIVSRGGMGAGDMKLFGVLGFVLGLAKVLLVFFLASVMGAIIGGALLALKIIDRTQPIPFGPYIVVATLITYFFGELIIEWYASLLV